MPARTSAALAVIAAVAVSALSGAPSAPAQPGQTVLTLAPAFFPMPPNLLRGEVFAGNAVVVVPYVNIPAAPNVNGGADVLDNMLHTTEGQVLVVGYSEGAEVADAWLRRYGPTSDVDPGRVSFLLVGDPEASINGCISIGLCRAGYGGKGFPPETRYSGTVFARQCDFYADAPNDPGNDAARNNRTAAKSHGGLFDGHTVGVHNDYTGVGLHDPTNRSTQVGNWTYMTAWTFPVPAAKQDVDDAALRPQIESGYRRGYAMP
jgi:hypothetical protein